MTQTPRPPRALRGGTLLGFIIGLLVGLGAALAVAVYVTKVPVPLVDRGVQRKPGQDAIEAERNKDWNPNAALSTKPAPPAAVTPADAQAAATPPAAAPAPAPSTPADPLGALIQDRAGSPGPVASVEAPPAVDPFHYFVQVGAFRGPDEAEAQRARLAMLGFAAQVSEREQAGRPVFRVRLGPYPAKADAEAQQERLKAQGVETALVRVQR
ncbi:SPOR domain-containing protein [Aquabacterium sp. A08]|uniref:SPOR domain-containing protein n=1 Tax=Aquabacterium sp. A08 TaxID=2718532 RepID=UPI0014235C8A|nr:SPOR domain-containing protein [Aquabacterium sp. A08]NIC43283.1 SPOR domain-containing protein [Aquabacterium sp. A08]